MSDDELTLKLPPGPVPEACYQCKTTDDDKLAWPEPWTNPVVMHGENDAPIRFCWDCAVNHLTPLAVNFGEPEGDAVKVEATLEVDPNDPTNKILRDWYAQGLRDMGIDTVERVEKPIVGFKGDSFFPTNVPMIVGEPTPEIVAQDEWIGLHEDDEAEEE